MEHYYEFVDHARVDHLWSMSWRALSKRYPTRWIRSGLIKESGVYKGESLRALLAFAIDGACDICRVLERDVVKHTLRSCSPQFWTVSELIANTLPTSLGATVGATAQDVTAMVHTAIQAFLDRRISGRVLWAVIKLHSKGPSDWDLRRAHRAKLPFKRLWDPVYAWQSTESLSGDEWTNCLKAADTQRFVRFLAGAYEENWPITGGLRPKRFRECEAVAELVKVTTRRVPRMTRPFVYRIWE